METHKSASIAYIHARPQGHPIHEAYANSLQPDRYFIDFALRWHDVQRPAIVRYLSWFLCALLFPNKRKYDVFYADGPVHFLAIMRFLGLISKRQKIVYLMADETLYFIKNKYYSPLAEKVLKWVLNKADGFICIGSQQHALATLLFPSVSNVLIYNAVPDNQFELLKNFQPNFEARDIITICNIGDSDVRCYYKGLDLMIEEVDRILDQLSGYSYCIYGDVSKRIQNKLLKNVKHTDRFFFKGSFTSLVDPLSNAKLCLHLSRGDAYPTSTLECSLAGIPVIVSEETGTADVLKKISLACVVDKESVLLHILSLINMDIQAYAEFKENAKSILGKYTNEQCLAHYLISFESLVEHIKFSQQPYRNV